MLFYLTVDPAVFRMITVLVFPRGYVSTAFNPIVGNEQTYLMPPEPNQDGAIPGRRLRGYSNRKWLQKSPMALVTHVVAY